MNHWFDSTAFDHVMFISRWAHVSTNFTYFFIFITISAGCCLENTTLGDVERLFNSTILTIDHRFRPKLNQSEPIVVHLSLMLLSLADVDEVQQSLSSNVLLTVNWTDELRQWDSQEYGGLTRVHPEPLDTWRPRLFLSNSIADRDMFDDDYAPLTVYNTGQTEWFPGGIMHSSCSMKMTYYPFDTQTCTLIFTTGESPNTIHLVAESSNISLLHYDRNGEWVIDNSEAVSLSVDGKSSVKFILKLNRLPSFTLLNVVIPINIISSLSSLVFIMPVQSGERVSFSITVLLSLTVYTSEISKDLPTNSESLPLLIMYLACLLLHSGVAIVANLIVLIRHFHRAGAMAKMKDQNKTSGNTKLSNSDETDHFDSCADNSPSCDTYNSRKIQFCRKIQSNKDNQADTYFPRNKNPPLFRNHKMGTGLRENFRTHELNKNVSEDHDENHDKIGFLKSMASRFLKYMNMIDIILFILFFGVWLVVTVVFMTLIAYGSM